MGYEKIYLCYLDIVNLEFCVWMGLLCVEDLLYGDGSESIFAICSLMMESDEGNKRDPIR